MRKLAFVVFVLLVVAAGVSGAFASGVNNPSSGAVTAPLTLTNNGANNTPTLTVNKVPAGSQSGEGIAVVMGPNATSPGISVKEGSAGNPDWLDLLDSTSNPLVKLYDDGAGNPVLQLGNGGGNFQITIDAGENFNLAPSGSGGVVAGGSYSFTSSTGRIIKYRNVATAGVGVPAIYGAANISAQNAAATITSYANPASDADYEVSGQVNVTAATAISTSFNCTYTDVGGTARTVIVPVTSLSGAFLAGGLITGTGSYESTVIHLRAKASTTITLLTATGTFNTVTYSASGAIRQLQ